MYTLLFVLVVFGGPISVIALVAWRTRGRNNPVDLGNDLGNDGLESGLEAADERWDTFSDKVRCGSKEE